MRAFVLDHPIAIALSLLLAALAFRLIDIFVLRLDERWGEIILSKTAALALVLALAWTTGAGLGAIGLHERGLGTSLSLGVGLTVAALSLGYATEFALRVRGGEAPTLQFLAVDPKTALAGAGAFAALLFVGNIINALAEEGLFRGAFIPLVMRRFAPWTTLAASALLFGLWHLPWAAKAIWVWGAPAPGGVAAILVSNFIPQALMGLVWGYLYMRTGNLLGAIGAHTIANTAINFVHIGGAAGLDAGLPARMIVFVVIMMAGLVVVEWTARSLGLPMARAWGA